MRTYTLFLTFFFLLSSPALAVIEITGSGHPSGPGACDGFIDVLAEGSAGPFVFRDCQAAGKAWK